MTPQVSKRSAGVEAALFALRCYKAYLSVLFAGTCRFEPTCSQYAY
jgi:putative component of membrane protein insertase Oxa1/YidC/SpoIIIJ protein YidD